MRCGEAERNGYNMNDKIIDFLKTPTGSLCFSMFCGIVYFVAVMKFVLSTTSHGWLMLLFIGPAVLFGAALVVIKLIRNNNENGNEAGNIVIFYFHAVLMVISILGLIA